MNTASSARKKILFHGRAILRIVGSLGFAVSGYAVAVSVYTERRWRAGNSRVFDPPKWHEYSAEEKGKIIAKRLEILKGLKDLYEMQPEAVEDPAVGNLFLENCILEDPRNRFVGRKEIIRAFSLLPKNVPNLHFVSYEPSHYENKIVVNNTRVFEVTNTLQLANYDPQRKLHSNFVIYMSKDDNGEEKVEYIADEWNLVSLLQPETHDMFMFAGTLARFVRRATAFMFYLLLKDDKTILNPFFLTELPKKIAKFFEERYDPNSKERNNEPRPEEDEVPLFNARQVRTND